MNDKERVDYLEKALDQATRFAKLEIFGNKVYAGRDKNAHFGVWVTTRAAPELTGYLEARAEYYQTRCPPPLHSLKGLRKRTYETNGHQKTGAV